MTEASVANITISNESLSKGGESIVVSGKGMSSTVKVDTRTEIFYLLDHLTVCVTKRNDFSR